MTNNVFSGTLNPALPTFTSLETMQPVVPSGNSLNCLRSPVMNSGRLLNMNKYLSPHTWVPDKLPYWVPG